MGLALDLFRPRYLTNHTGPKETQFERVFGSLYGAALRKAWLTLAEIAEETGDPEASVSAQLRHLRKPRFGRHVIERRRRRNIGRQVVWEYRMSG